MSKISSLLNYISKRQLSLTSPCEGKRNFRKFMFINKRGSRLHKERQAGPNPELPIDRRGVRETGITVDGRYVRIPEMVPELIVPDLTDCEFKPYVSYKVTDVVQDTFTSQQLFDAIYSEKIVKDFKAGKLEDSGFPVEPSKDEKLTPEEALLNARKTGSDIF